MPKIVVMLRGWKVKDFGKATLTVGWTGHPRKRWKDQFRHAMEHADLNRC